jgi:hypothetical protein
METTKLNSGFTVLAKKTKWGISPVTYTNMTQARRRAEGLKAIGVNCGVIGLRPLYVRIYEGLRIFQEPDA